jgi:GT2 family glycosyltransferase
VSGVQRSLVMKGPGSNPGVGLQETPAIAGDSLLTLGWVTPVASGLGHTGPQNRCRWPNFPVWMDGRGAAVHEEKQPRVREARGFVVLPSRWPLHDRGATGTKGQSVAPALFRPEVCADAPLLSADGRANVAQARARPRVHGKFLFVGEEKLYVRGVTYGAFEPDPAGREYHDLEVIDRDFALMAESGVNAVRIPHTMPPRVLLDAAEHHGLKVMVGLSAEQHAGYLADGRDASDLERAVRDKVAAVAGHPAILCYALGNEIEPTLARWVGRRTIERCLERLYEAVKDEDPGGIVTYVNYPTTEYLDLPFLDLLAFNVYLEKRDRLEAYLARLHSLAGDRPLLMSEVGLDALRNGEDVQANVLDWQIRQIFASGCAGAFVFSWTDEWFRAGSHVDDWAFGLTRPDRTPKPALAAVTSAFADVPFAAERDWPRVSVVVCSFNGGRTLRATLEGVERLEYPELEVIVVDDGSTDDTPSVAAAFDVRLIRTPNRGLASARNVGAGAATGEIVVYLDADAWPDPHWLHYLADTFDRTRSAAVGGPNIPPRGSNAVAESVARSPGGPVHVLVSDAEAEHIPGCNFAIRKAVLEKAGGFDPQFRAAGDDVDLCWRLQEAGQRIGFSPAAVVWHERRDSVRAYWRQQCGYGRAEALLERKWPHRYNAVGHISWGGRLYGNAFARLLGFRRSRIYNGVWGFAPFQSLYQASPSVLDSVARLPEWYLVIGGLACLSALGLFWAPLAYLIPLLAAAVLLPLGDALYSGLRTSFGRRPAREIWQLRAITSFLHLTQPFARLLGRIRQGLAPWRWRRPAGMAAPKRRKIASWLQEWRPPEERLADLDAALKGTGLPVRSGGAFDQWDLEVRGGMFGAVRVLFAAEDHGAGTQYVRFRVTPRYSRAAASVLLALLALATAAAFDGGWIAAVLVGAIAAVLLGRSVLECAVASAAACRCLDHAVEPDDAAAEFVVAQPAVDAAGARLRRSRASMSP